ncbi:MAG TPA: 3-oxoacyl-ACP reductase family protein [Chryseolinea sp.]|nr:3-oxoacyl-ACP reductase family protein [Chryseolinea sp.]
MNYDLNDRVALVTGGSRGLGAAISLALAQSGAKVAINYFSRTDEARALQEQIIKSGGNAEIFKADVTDEVQVKKLCESAVKKFGPIDILVLNATLVHVHKPIEELVWQDMLDHLNFFVKSPLLLVQQVLPSMKKRKYGRIINIGSEVFERGIPRFSSYVSAKGAQLGLTRSWANELGSDQITVNLVAPGWIPTEMHENDPAEMKLDYARHVPLKRMGDPSDIGEIVAFLASDAAKFITGQRITVNGGNTMA